MWDPILLNFNVAGSLEVLLDVERKIKNKAVSGKIQLWVIKKKKKQKIDVKLGPWSKYTLVMTSVYDINRIKKLVDSV